MTLVVNINHWLDKDGDLPEGPPRLRWNALRILRFVEYGGPLPQLHGRETLIAASATSAANLAPGSCGQ